MPQLMIEMQATAGTTSETKTFSAAAEQRFLDWIWAHYAPYDVSDITNISISEDTPANRAQSVRNWMSRNLEKTWETVKKWEEEEAAKLAKEAVPELT